MERLWADTSVDVEQRMLEGLRSMTPAEKLHRVVELNRAVEAMAEARIRQQYGPDLADEEVKLRLAALRLPRQTMIELFDWDPETKGY